MGTITKIRQISPYVFIVFAVLFVVFMMLSDNISQLASGGGENIQTAAICKINGEKIYYKDFEERIRVRVEQMRKDPQNEGRDIDEQQVRNQIWDELVREKLLSQAGDQFGIKITDDEILDILIENPPDYLKQPFTDTSGNFNRELYLKLITNPAEVINYIGGEDPTQMTAEVRQSHIANFRNMIISISDELRKIKLQDAIGGTLIASHTVSSPSYMERKYVDDNSSANINYIYINPFLIQDSIEVTTEEMRDYYEKNKNNFKVKNERKVKYLTFPIMPSADDTARIVRRVTKMQEDLAAVSTSEAKDSIFSIKLNEFSGTENDWALMQDINPQVASFFANANERDVVGPITMPDGTRFYRLDGRRSGTNEVAKASHILIGFGENNNKDSAKAVANEIKKSANTSNFAILAMEKSEDKGSAQRGGDLGYFGKGRMVPEFEKATFGAKVGSIVGPIESQFGYHIIYVEDKKSDELKYSEIIFTTGISNATKNQIKRDAFAAMKQIEAGENIDSLAVKLNATNPGIMVQETPFATKDRPTLGSMFLTNQIFESKKGNVLEPREIYNGQQVVVVQVAEIRKEGIGTFEDDTLQIKTKLTKIKKLDLAKKRADDIYNIVKNASTLEVTMELPYDARVGTAAIKNNGSIPGNQSDYTATMNAFMLPTDVINAPVRCESGYYIFEIRDRLIPTVEQAKGATDVTKSQHTRNLFDTWFNKFKETSEIIDYRNKYYQDF